MRSSAPTAIVVSTVHPKGERMTHRSITVVAGVVLLTLAALTAAGCGGNGSAARPTTKDGRAATLGVADENLGKVLVNSQGHTLYLFQRDSGAKSTCTGACAVNWPPLHANSTPTVGQGANASTVTTTRRHDGTSQVSYNSHPLYLFVGDKNAGDANGEGVNAFGGSWFAVSPAGNQVAPQTPSPGGYGY
jgi:predicted lipoprotein with Yx(FWY)xxD motif